MTYTQSVAWDLAVLYLSLDETAWNDCTRDDLERDIAKMERTMTAQQRTLAHAMKEQRQQQEYEYYCS